MQQDLHQIVSKFERMIEITGADTFELSGWTNTHGKSTFMPYIEADFYTVGWDSQSLLRETDPEVSLYVCLSVARRKNILPVIYLGHYFVLTGTDVHELTQYPTKPQDVFTPQSWQVWCDMVARASSAHGALQIAQKVIDRNLKASHSVSHSE